MARCPQCAHARGPGVFCPWCGAARTDHDGEAARHRQGGDTVWLPWLGAAVVLALVGSGAALLGVDRTATTTSGASAVAPTSTAPADVGPPDEADQEVDREVYQEASGEPTVAAGQPVGATEAAQAVEVADRAVAAVPATAPPQRAVTGAEVGYDAARMLDGVPRTAWRMPGDGTGETIVLRLDEPTTLRRVGLVNGYAKTAVDGTDWYRANRRVRLVAWRFDDGTTLTQRLADRRGLQVLDVDEVRTSRVRLELLEVSDPGRDPARDYTAISEVSLAGRTAAAP